MKPLRTEVMTGDGRLLSLRELDPGDMLDLIEAAGSALSAASGAAWLGYAARLACVTAIDRVPVQFPATKEELKDLARKLGNDGVRALNTAFEDVEPQSEKDLETAKN